MPIRPKDPRKMNEDDELVDIAGGKDATAAMHIVDPAVASVVVVRVDVDSEPIQE